MVRNLLHVHGSDKCVLHGRCNEFVMAGIACVDFSVSGATCNARLLAHRYKMMARVAFGDISASVAIVL